MNIFYKISIDRVNANYISGWCFHRFKPNSSPMLQCFQGDELVAEAEATQFREDLKALGLHPTGKCGFEFISESPGGFNFSKPISIRVKGKRIKLADITREHLSGKTKGIYQPIRRLAKRRNKFQKTSVFMHIPKTAGTSFNTLVQSLYPRGTVINHIELLPEGEYVKLKDRYEYISGHLRFGQLKQHFSSSDCLFYTIIREPYAQLQSHLKWLIQTAANPDEKYFKTTNPVIYRLGRRLQRVAFSDKDSLLEFVNSLSATEAAFVDNLQTRYFLDQQPIRVDPGDFEHAAANSSRFELIGLTERYDDFMDVFIKLNGLKVPPKPGQMNISRSEPLFDLENTSVRDILQPLVHVDLQLYDLLAAQTD